MTLPHAEHFPGALPQVEAALPAVPGQRNDGLRSGLRHEAEVRAGHDAALCVCAGAVSACGVIVAG